MSKRKNEKNALSAKTTAIVDDLALFERVAAIIENRKYRAGAYANREVTLMYWEIGQYVGSVLLGGERPEYGKKILATLSQELMGKYGNNFDYTKITRMIKFAELFPDIEILATLSQDLSWSHFRELLPLKSDEARLYYAHEAASRRLGVRDLRKLISRKAFERQEIANTQLTPVSAVPFNMFKDPYLLDTLGLKDNYLEADLENAILVDLEAFFLEFGRGFSFVERQKRMNVGGEDIALDLLFYHRILKRLVAVELKLGRFKASYKGQMELYLSWLDKYERQDGEEAPIGLILCATANREKIELLDMDKAGIAVAEYWTHMPPKAEFEAKIKAIMIEAKERLARRKLLSQDASTKQIEYYYEPIGDGEDDDE